MSDSRVLVSVRGEAERLVPPDSGLWRATIEAVEQDKPAALAAAAEAQERVIAALRGLGGVPFTAEAARVPLAWSFSGVATADEHEHNERTGRYGPTGRVSATISLTISVRRFDLLDRIGAALSSHAGCHVHDMQWHVDHDNPGWSQVRADAVHAAVRRGYDYAAALGGRLIALEHLADTGLLDNGPQRRQPYPSAIEAASGGGESATPSLDPVPQTLAVAVEARFTAVDLTVPDQPTTPQPPD